MTIAPPAMLILEGVSAGRWAIAGRAGVLAWLELPDRAERLQRAVDRDGEGSRRFLQQWQDDEDLPKKRAEPMDRIRVEPIEPIRIEPLEPSRLRRVAPMKFPFTTVLLDDSSRAAAVERGSGDNPAALNIAGLRMVPVGKELAAYLGKGSDRGLLVIDVPQWAADALHPGDVVLSVDGTRVRAGDSSD